MEKTLTTHELNAIGEYLDDKKDQVKGEITVTQNADGTHTGRCGKQRHTTRRINWDDLLD